MTKVSTEGMEGYIRQGMRKGIGEEMLSEGDAGGCSTAGTSL